MSDSLGPGDTYHLTPLYDVLTAQPNFDARQIDRNQMRLAMSVGKNRHYKFDEINGRHFIQTGERAGLPKTLVQDAIEIITDTAETELETIELELPADFPEAIHLSVKNALTNRLCSLLARPTE